MNELFLQLLKACIVAGWVTVAVLLLRLFLQKTPRWVRCLLWALVGLRLILPVSLESRLSLVPSGQIVSQTLSTLFAGLPVDGVLTVCAYIWLVGVALMVFYGAISSISLYRSVRAAVPVRGNIYIGDDIETPFILGVFLPKIYLPSGLDADQQAAVIAHEEAHLRRRDHLWKPVGFALLCLYWYNPFLWVAYILLCRDIELACDEAVLKNMDNREKVQYSQTLVACANGQRQVLGCPLAFGELGVKTRIKAILSYKKPALWLVIAGIVCLAVSSVCLLTDSKPCVHEYTYEEVQAPTCQTEGIMLRVCKHCSRNEKDSIPVTEHTYGEGYVLQPATCSQPGQMEFCCSCCNARKTQPIPTEAHTYDETFVEKVPNCTQPGEKAARCVNCGEKVTVEILPANQDHNMVTRVTQEATCTHPGAGERVCSRCGKTEQITYEQLSHNYQEKSRLPATCSQPGEKHVICTLCGKEQWIPIPIDPDAHYWLYMSYRWPDEFYECMYCHRHKED